MDNQDVGAGGGLHEGTGSLSNAPTLDQVYAAIMSQKRKAQELPPVPAATPEPVARFRSGGNGANLRNNTLEQLLFQGLAAGQEEGPLSIMRSNTMENILRETLSGGRELQELLLDWNHSLPEEKLVEGLSNDMQAIDAAPPDVATMRRTFTLERILSGAESDLAGLMRANQQHQQHVVRQHSGAAAAAAAAAAGSGGGEGMCVSSEVTRPGGGGGGSGGCGGRTSERLQRQESIHRLACSSGPNQQPRPPSSGPGGAGAKGPATSHSHSQHSHSRGGGGGPGLLRASHGSGRYGAAAALAAEDDAAAAQRSPKRLKALHLAKAEGGPPPPPAAISPERTWSQSLLDLAKAAAALDGKDLDDLDDEGGTGGGEGGTGGGGGAGVRREEEGKRELRQETERDRRQQRQRQQQAGAGDPAGGEWPDGHGAAAPPPPLPPPGAASAMQLLRSLSGTKAAAAGQQVARAAAAGGGGAAAAEPSSQDTKMLSTLQSEVARLHRDNDGLNGQLEAVLAQVELVQQRNSAMKAMLLEACHAKGIPADMELLNVSLQHHRAPPMSDEAATHVAATVLGLNGGDVVATVQHLIGIALLRIAEGGGFGGR